MEGYAYRVYDEAAICRLRQIVVLRKLRVPAKQIVEIFTNNNAAYLIEIFERNLNKLTDRDVRIIYLPPATVASIHMIGDRPEDRASAVLCQFVETTGIARVKPDFRYYGFTHLNGTNDDDHGYEYWVTIPEDMDLHPPMTKKCFTGGLYAAHTIVFGDFEKWHWLWEWVENNPQFEINLGDPECMDGSIEEHLNYFNQYNLKNFDKDKFQMDLLIPIKERE
jgi:hypothetical protein